MNFDVVIDGEGDQFVARVIESPAGEASNTFGFPFSRLELENFLLRVGQSRRSVRRIDSPQMEAARQFGAKLYDTVFAGEVRTCFRRSLDEADRHEQGLRVRLRFEDALDMADLPWEYLYSTGLNRFVGLSTHTPLVRYIDLPTRIRPLQVAPPLRILVMVSSPTDYLELDVDREYIRLEEALSDLIEKGHVLLDRLDEASLSSLQKRLRQHTYHMFHYIGHGGFDEARDDGVLMLEDEQGRGRPVSGHELGTILHDHKTLRLAVLNSCEGARSSTTDPFSGTAQSLVQQGIPAVVAMQFEISDEGAIVFAHEFYAAIADGYPVDAAATEARKAMFTRSGDVEWGTPVLNMRSPDGMVFDIIAPAVAPKKAEPEPMRKPPEPATLPTTQRNTTVTPPSVPPVTPLITPPHRIATPSDNSEMRPNGTKPSKRKRKIPIAVVGVSVVLAVATIAGIAANIDSVSTTPTTERIIVPDTVLDRTTLATEPRITAIDRPGPPTRAERIDGIDFDGFPLWSDTPIDLQTTDFTVFSDQWDGFVDHESAWRFGWDDEFFYALVLVNDDFYSQPETGPRLFLGDSLNLDIDTDLAGDANIAGPNQDDFQLIASPLNAQQFGEVVLFRGTGTIFEQVGTDGEVFGVDVSTGDDATYFATIFLPWSDLGLRPSAGDELGFRVSATDNDQTFPLQEVMFSNTADSSLFDVTTWGTLTLDP